MRERERKKESARERERESAREKEKERDGSQKLYIGTRASRVLRRAKPHGKSSTSTLSVHPPPPSSAAVKRHASSRTGHGGTSGSQDASVRNVVPLRAPAGRQADCQLNLKRIRRRRRRGEGRGGERQGQ